MANFTGGPEDFTKLQEMVPVPKEYYDRMLLAMRLCTERFETKNKLYAIEKDLELAMLRLRPYTTEDKKWRN